MNHLNSYISENCTVNRICVRIRVMVFNANYNNISAILWQTVLLVKVLYTKSNMIYYFVHENIFVVDNITSSVQID